jgi:peptide-methionine (R)-S-oxide reductase
MTDAEWRARLDPEAYRILRRANTERAFSSELNGNHHGGTYVCAGCGQALFSSADKFDSGTGWPSYSQVLPGAVGTRVDSSWFLIRTEVYCTRCGGHLGHLFADGPPPTGLRYCINGGALRFKGA